MYYDRPPKKRGLFSYFVVALIAATIGGLVSVYIAPNYLYGKLIPFPEIYTKEVTPNVSPVNILPADNISSVEAVAKKSMSSVVGITTTQIQREFIWEREVTGLGSGVVVNSNGYILTNSHVIGDGEAKDIKVLFENGDSIAGKVLWNDTILDLAVVKVNADGLHTADLGDSDSLEVGELAVAIGNPLGLDFQRTVTSGVISGLDRAVRVSQFNILEGLIQTDASINRGNSGGPLLNKMGEVIGINTVKIGTQVGEGLGFAIPINVAKPIIVEIINKGDFKTVFLGIVGNEVERFEREHGIELNINNGVVVMEVAPGAPADKAGIRPGDIIIEIDGQIIKSRNHIRRALYKYKAGDKAELMIIRNQKKIGIDIVFTDVR